LLVRLVLSHPLLTELSVTAIFPSNFDLGAQARNPDELINIIDEIDQLECVSSLKILRREGMTPFWHGPQWTILNKLYTLNSNVLEEIRLGCGPFPNDDSLKAFCSRNGSTLMSSDRRGGWLRAAAFNINTSDFNRTVRHLYVWGMQQINGTSNLPPTLETIVFIGAMTSDDTHHLLLNIPNLREVVLGDVDGSRRGHGIRLTTLRKVIKRRRITRLILDMNGTKFPPEGISNGDRTNPVMLIKRGGGSTYLDLELNQRGFYINFRI